MSMIDKSKILSSPPFEEPVIMAPLPKTTPKQYGIHLAKKNKKKRRKR